MKSINQSINQSIKRKNTLDRYSKEIRRKFSIQSVLIAEMEMMFDELLFEVEVEFEFGFGFEL
jgi:hypothetical protein